MPGFTALLIHPVAVVTPDEDFDEPDRQGNPTETDAAAVPEVWRIEPTSATEELANRDTRVTEYLGFAPATSVVTAISRVEFDGRAYRVRGDPLPFYGRTSLHHYEVTLEEVSG